MMYRIIAKKRLFLLVFTLFAGLCMAAPAFSVELFTAEEARLADMPPASGSFKSPLFEHMVVMPESAVAGPEIKVLSPEPEKAYPSPLKVLVKFVPREGTQVDLASLKVECLKFLTINITGRVKEYVNNDGINVEKAELPSGNHKIRVTLADMQGGTTSTVFSVTVR